MCPRRSYWEYSPFRADYPVMYLQFQSRKQWGMLSVLVPCAIRARRICKADYPKTKTVSLVNWIHLNGKKKLSWGQLSMTFREIVIDNKNISQWQSVSFSLTFSFILIDNRFDCHWLLNPLSLTFSLIVIDFFCGLGLSWNSKRLEWRVRMAYCGGEVGWVV